MPPIAQYVLNGVVTGGILALPAVAFSLLWQLLRFPNFAVSTYLTVGAYAALTPEPGLARLHRGGVARRRSWRPAPSRWRSTASPFGRCAIGVPSR